VSERWNAPRSAAAARPWAKASTAGSSGTWVSVV
jgi:hypothetical protein